VRGCGGLVPFHRLVEHLLARVGGHGRLQEPGAIPISHGDFRWSGAAIAAVRSGGSTGNLQLVFIVPLVAYSYVAFDGLKGHRIRRDGQAAF